MIQTMQSSRRTAVAREFIRCPNQRMETTNDQ
jgi:hypothetical protein